MLGLQNKFIMAPVKLGYSDGKGNVTSGHINFYNERSKNIGAVTLEPLYLNAGLREIPTQLGIDDDKKVAELKKLTNLIHKNGAKVIAHLNHPGRMANPKIPGNYFWSSTNIACENGGAIPEAMNKKMMDSVIAQLINGAKRAEKANFDIIELQFGHGYLFAQFISPAVNNRKDEYGGEFINRIKFPLEAAKYIVEAVNIPVIARISADEMIPNGFHLDEMIKFTQLLQNAGIKAIHVSAGSACSTPPWFFQHMFIPKGKTWELAAEIKKQLKIPVIFVGKINSNNDIEFLKSKYNPDYFAIGRALVADPHFVSKHLNIQKGIIRPCLACAEGCLGGVKSGKGLGCVVNPLVNTNYPKLEIAGKSKHFAVVGGGLAGMQAAITLSDRNYTVDLYEKNDLGGQFNLAWLPPHKESMRELINYFIKEIKAHKVNVINNEATEDLLVNNNYDAVIMATGAVPAVPPIKGLKKFYWTEFLDENFLPKNEKVLVIGGGLIGLEVASKLVNANNKVIIVEMLDEIARGMEMIEKALTVKKLKTKNTEIFVNHKVIEIENDKVIIETEGNKKTIDNIDKIVVATGMKSFVPFSDIGKIPVFIVGDAKKTGKAQDAIHDAYELSLTL